MQVVEHQDERPVCAQRRKKACQCVKGTVAQLPPILGDSGHMRAGAVVKADQLANQCRAFFGARAQRRPERSLKLAMRALSRIAVENVAVLGQQVAQHTVAACHAAGFGLAPQPAADEVSFLASVLEFIQQAALA